MVGRRKSDCFLLSMHALSNDVESNESHRCMELHGRPLSLSLIGDALNEDCFATTELVFCLPLITGFRHTYSHFLPRLVAPFQFEQFIRADIKFYNQPNHA